MGSPVGAELVETERSALIGFISMLWDDLGESLEAPPTGRD
ncbi:MAG TPA: hypothetical protein VH370_00085 [Humisphaera sp.]|nr:hypothetical protein [Humisphaera sp.]